MQQKYEVKYNVKRVYGPKSMFQRISLKSCEFSFAFTSGIHQMQSPCVCRFHLFDSIVFTRQEEEDLFQEVPRINHEMEVKSEMNVWKSRALILMQFLIAYTIPS